MTGYADYSKENKIDQLSNARITVEPQSGKVYNNKSCRSNLVKNSHFGEVIQRQGFLKLFREAKLIMLYSKLFQTVTTLSKTIDSEYSI